MLGEDYAAAPTCATCHMSGNMRNGGRVTHDPGERISWTNRPPVSLVMDTDVNHAIVTETDPEKRRALIADTAEAQAQPDEGGLLALPHARLRQRLLQAVRRPGHPLQREVRQAGPGASWRALREQRLLTHDAEFDEEIEWTWFYLWHHEGRRARHGASMMAPDYTHWHGMYEVAERFYMELIPQAREIVEHARADGKARRRGAVEQVIDEILARPEHAWFERGRRRARPSESGRRWSAGTARQRS